jgi:hypothetical protein
LQREAQCALLHLHIFRKMRFYSHKEEQNADKKRIIDALRYFAA